MKKHISLLVCAIMACALIVGCGQSNNNATQADSGAVTSSNAASEIPDPEEGLYVYPEEANLADSKLKEVASAYAEYLTDAMAQEGYSAKLRIEGDGSVHYDGIRPNSEGQPEEVRDLKVFASVRDCYAYLYNLGQVDLEGNLLVQVSEGVEAAVADAVEDVQAEEDASSAEEDDSVSTEVPEGSEDTDEADTSDSMAS